MQFENAKKFILYKLETELSPLLSYHNVGHVVDVYHAAEIIAEKEGIEGEDLLLLLTAALYHDAGFLIGNNEHELKSCEIARQYLPQYEYSNQQIDKICEIIMATKIPQSPTDLLGEIICDADLDYLGRDDFFSIGNRLYQELLNLQLLTSEDEWNRLQVKFLDAHHYFTKTAISLRNAVKEQNLQAVKNKIQ